MKRNRSQAIVCRQDGKILLVKHKLFGRVFFTLPGGGIEDGETPAEAALRELKRRGLCRRKNPASADSRIQIRYDEPYL